MMKVISPCWIVSTQRSGTTHFCELINNTNLFSPLFDEHFNFVFKRNNSQVCNFRYCKIQPEQMERAKFDLYFVKNVFPNIKFVKITRNSNIDKAISLYCAEKTGVWSITDFPQKIKTSEGLKKFAKSSRKYLTQTLEIDVSHLHNCYNVCLLNEKKCVSFLENFEFLEINYNEITSNPMLALEKFFEYLNIHYSNIESLISGCFLKKMTDRAEKLELRKILEDYENSICDDSQK